MSDLIPDYEAWLRTGCADSTATCRVRVLRRVDADLQPRGLDKSHTREITAYFGKQTWSRWTRHTYFNHLNAYYWWGVDFGHLTMNPMAAMNRPPEGDRLPNPCTDEELALALESFPMRPMGMAVRLAAYAGLRCCEIVEVRREKCTEDTLRVLGKGGLTRTVAMSPILWADIKDLPNGPLCLGARGRPLTAKCLSQLQTSFWLRIGLRDLHLHRLRHWFGTTLLDQGADLRTVQELMGHASIASTVGYTKVVDRQRRAAVRLLPDVGDHQEPGHGNAEAVSAAVPDGEHQPVGTRLVPTADATPPQAAA